MKTARFKQRLNPLIAMAVLGCSAAFAADSPPLVAFQQKPGQLFITIGGQPFATYIYEDPVITRPHFAHVKTSCGIQATRNQPPQADDPKDHPTFHPGIWLAFGDINGSKVRRAPSQSRKARNSLWALGYWFIAPPLTRRLILALPIKTT